MHAGACGRLVECAEVAPVLRYVTGSLRKLDDKSYSALSNTHLFSVELMSNILHVQHQVPVVIVRGFKTRRGLG